jgi:hypothetical protein
MVAGYQRYYTANPNAGIFPGIYLNPLSGSTTPDAFLKDFSSAAFATTFDSKNNLYVADWARSRVEIYLDPIRNLVTTVTPTNEPPTSTPTIPPPTITPSRTPTPTPKPSVTVIPTRTPTPPPPTKTPTPAPDRIRPSVSLTAPLNQSHVSRNTVITMQANASDNIKVTKVNFYVNSSIKCTDLTSPYSCAWSVPSAKNKKYSISATAYDGANNSSSSTVSVTSK